jgi:hypothetical protein
MWASPREVCRRGGAAPGAPGAPGGQPVRQGAQGRTMPRNTYGPQEHIATINTQKNSTAPHNVKCHKILEQMHCNVTEHGQNADRQLIIARSSAKRAASKRKLDTKYSDNHTVKGMASLTSLHQLKFGCIWDGRGEGGKSPGCAPQHVRRLRGGRAARRGRSRCPATAPPSHRRARKGLSPNIRNYWGLGNETMGRL